MPDTSGMMAPMHVFEKIHDFSLKNPAINISIHCHNDMGMASANTVTGIAAGARTMEVSALGIGERNGIGDLYTTVKTLKNMGFEIRVNTDDMDTFRQYYRFVDSIVHEQTGCHLLTADTPAFGTSVSTHVAGTHAHGEFGLGSKQRYALNVLCGKHLVEKYLDAHNLDCPSEIIDTLTQAVKDRSAATNRCINPQDIKKLISIIQA
jgi:2-isopropylmalate synthase